MPLLDEKAKGEVKNILNKLIKPITIRLFTQSFECEQCKLTHQLLNEIVDINNKLRLEVHDLLNDTDIVSKYEIDKIPAIVVEDEKDRGIRFYGVPAGYEFSSLLSALLMVSTEIVQLLPETKAWLENMTNPLHLQVFVTPTCPYCPPAVMLAHKLAYFSDKIKADMVEIIEFPHLAVKYSVQGVPRIVINETMYLDGALPEDILVTKLKEMEKNKS